MKMIRRLTVAQHERVLVFRDRRFETILEPGVHWLFDPLRRVELQVYDLTVAEFEHPRAEFLLQDARAVMERYFMIVETGDTEVGVVSKQGHVTGLLGPGRRQLYWKGPIDVTVEKIDFAATMELPGALARVLVRAKQPQRALKTELVDRRVQTMEVAGQDILTRDKVSLRVNLTALWQVVDAVQARAAVVNVVESVYKELQFALRAAVGGRSLDELLGDKGVLDREIGAAVATRLEGQGVVVKSVGVKDVILPGEMKTILNQVVEAEKRAQANLIQRREETAATRSLLNTARLMDDNPTLLRLKELETLEKVTEKIGHLTVFGGLEGVMKDTVRIQLPAR